MSRSTAIILLNYNTCELLRKFLPSLVKHSPSWATIYLIDNASTDESLEFVRKHYPQIKLILLEKNFGYAGGYYHGLQQIDEDYWVLMNTDVEVTENWLLPLIKHLQNDEQLAAIQPKIKSFRQKTHFEHAGAAGGFIDLLGYPFCRGRLFDNTEKDEGQYNEYTHCFWASGACFAIKKTAYQQAGGFDPRFFMHMEEIDLCWRLQRLGFTVACEPKSEVFHLGGASLPYESPRKFYFNFRNNLILLQKNIPANQLISILIIRCLLDWVAAFRELTLGKFKHSISIGVAWFSFLKALLVWRKHYNHSKQQPIKTIYKKSILYDFFFLSHHKYSSLRHENTNRWR